MIKKFKNSKAFTLIELIVVVGVIGILVLIASSNFSNQTEKAKQNAALADMKIVADATDMYNIDNDDWPRLTDVPYTSEELEAYTEKFYDTTGKEVTLDENGNYYDIDYDKLSQYAKAPVNKENYILQNPVGKVFYMENLTAEGKSRVDYGQPSTPTEPEESALYEFTSHTFTNAGKTGHTGPNQSMLDNAYRGSEVEGHVTSDNGIQLWTVPKTGTYRVEAYGAQGGGGKPQFRGGLGGSSRGDFVLSEGDKIRILVGQTGSKANGTGNWWSGGGGGGTFVSDESLNPLIVSGGGSGSYISSNGLDGGRIITPTSIKNGVGGDITSRGRNGGSSGAGFHGNGKYHSSVSSKAISFTNGGIGSIIVNYPHGADGGFGGGGSGGGNGGGAGGGYIGGDWSQNTQSQTISKGGSSFNSGENQENSVGNTGHGKVIITYIKE